MTISEGRALYRAESRHDHDREPSTEGRKVEAGRDLYQQLHRPTHTQEDTR